MNIVFSFLLLLFSFGAYSQEVTNIAEKQSAYTVDNLPSPKVKGQDYFVSNPNGILSSSTVQQLDEISQQIEATSGAEFAIVIVDDYVGDSDFDFALALFNKWGIGKKESNTGLLLFIAKDRHEYRFISGYGMEGLFPDVYLKRVGEKYLVPNFRNDDYDRGVLEASTFIAEILNSPNSVAELERMMPEAKGFWSLKNPVFREITAIVMLFFILYLYIYWIGKYFLKGKKKQLGLFVPIFQGCGCLLLLMFFSVFIFAFVFNNVEEIYQVKNYPYFLLIFGSLVLAMQLTGLRTRIKEGYSDAEEQEQAYKKYLKYLFIPILITPLAWIDFIAINRRFVRNRGRFTPPDSSGNWNRIVRSSKATSKGLLSEGERNEEKIGARNYEIWKNIKDGKVLLIPWEISSKYKTCPQCGFYTLEMSATKTINDATYSSSGEGEELDECHNCSYRLHKSFFTIPKKVRSSSSGRGGSSRSGGGGGGSFGGGSSGGGGAGGRW